MTIEVVTPIVSAAFGYHIKEGSERVASGTLERKELFSFKTFVTKLL